MKTLILMRHAKSAWDAGDLSDHDRPLSERGRAAAPIMGQWLKSNRMRPDLILCSTAKRATETLEAVSEYLPKTTETCRLETLYMALPREILAAIAKVKADTLMLIGHNPGIGSLAHWLAGDGDPKQLARMQDKFPTGAIAIIEFNVDSWQDIDGEQGRLLNFASPKELPKA